MDSDLINVVVAIVVIWGVVRWWSKPGNPAAATPAGPSLGFRARNVTPAMIASVQSAFPQEPRANVHYDLLRTGNVQVTSNTLIEKGFLPPPPPAFYQLYPQPDQPPPTPATQAATNAHSSNSKATPPSLLQRFQIDEASPAQSTTPAANTAGKAAWLDTPEKREASLRERKAQMIMAARQKLLQKQAKGKGKEVV